MKAYQLIYTACGKERTGSFSTWSKSNEITPEEENEIITVMSYRTSENAPYNPTEEDIKKYFPRIYSCFILSTGRKVLSTSTYIGPVYSDLDKRSGNFIIHAFVFDVGLNPNPLSVFTNTQFKKELLPSEWKNDAPLNLQAIDYNDNFILNKSNINNIVNSKSDDALKGLLESAYLSLNNKGILVFNDDFDSMVAIYSLIYAMMPESLLTRLTFSNQYSTTIEFNLTSNNTKRIAIRNPIDPNNYIPFTNEELSVKHFDFINNEIDNVEPSPFIENAFNILKANGLEECQKFIRFVKDLQTKFAYSVDDILNVYYVVNKKYSKLSSPSVICDSIKKAAQASLISFGTVCNDVFNEYFEKGILTYNCDTMSLLLLCYKYLVQAQKTKIFRGILNNLESCGVNVNGDYSSFNQSLESALGEMYKDLISQLVNDLDSRQIFLSSTNRNYVSYIFDVSIKNINNVEFKNIISKFVENLIKSSDLVELKSALDKVEYADRACRNELVANYISPLFDDLIYDEVSFENRIEYFDALKQEEIKELFLKLMLANIDNNKFIKIYVNLEKRNPKIEQFSLLIKNEPSLKLFFTKIECLEFENKQTVTLADLTSYFNKHYLNNEDAGSFYNQVKRFLENCQSMRLENALSVYSVISNVDFGKYALWNVALFIYDFVLDQPIESIAKLAPESYKKILDLNKKLSDGNRLENKKLNIVKTYLLLNFRFGDQSNLDKIKDNLVYSYLDKNQFDDFFKKYDTLIANYYLNNKKKKVAEYNKLIEIIFTLPIHSIDSFISSMLNHLFYLNKKDASELTADLLLYGFSFDNYEAQNIRKEVENFFDVIGAHKSKAILNDNVDLFKSRGCNKLIDYVNQYNSDHLGFFESIKAKFSKKEK